MANDLNNVNSKKVPFSLYIIITVLGALIIAIGYFGVYLQQNKKNITQKTTETNPIPNKLPNLEIAKLSLSWLDKQKDDELYYTMGCNCIDDNCQQCQESVYTRRVIPYVVWAKYNYFMKTGTENYLLSMELDLDKLGKSGTQYSLWSCKLLYDLEKDSKIPDVIKRKARLACANSTYEVFLEGQTLSADLLESNLKKNMSNTIKGLPFDLGQLDSEDKDKLKNNFARFAGYTSEIYIHSIWQLESLIEAKDLKDEAKQSFNKALEAYSLLETKSVYNDSVIGIASLDLYRMTDDSDYLDFAKFIYNRNKDIEYTNIVDFTHNFLFSREIFKIINDKDYVSDTNFQKNISTLINKDFDYLDFKGYKFGIGAFASGNFYPTIENALMVGILTNE